MSIVIYKTDVSPPCRAVLIIAEILGVDFESKEVNCVTKETLTPAFLKKNPLHTIPVLEEGDFILVDSHAIITYLVSKYGTGDQKNLYPEDLNLRATIDQLLFFEATKIFPVLKTIIVEIVHEKALGPTQKQIAEVEEGYKILDIYLESTDYVACDHLTVTDVSILTSISGLETIVPIDKKYRKVITWLDKLKNTNWYQKINVPGLNKLVEVVKDGVKKNSV